MSLIKTSKKNNIAKDLKLHSSILLCPLNFYLLISFFMEIMLKNKKPCTYAQFARQNCIKMFCFLIHEIFF